MLNFSKLIHNSIKEELALISPKVNGLMLLEILKYKLIDKIRTNYSNYSPQIDEQDTVTTNLISENNEIDIKIKLYKSKIVNVKSELKSNLLILCISEMVEISLYSSNKKNNFIFKCIPMTGLVLPKGTLCSFNYKKNSIILKINLNENNADIEKKE